MILFAAACGGGSDSESGSGGSIQGDTIVVSQEDLEAAQAERDGEAEEAEALTVEEVEPEDLDASEADAAEEDEDGIEVAEAEEDELDGLLNAVTLFRNCIEDEGFEFTGAPGQDGATVEDFDQDYLQALGACATETDIVSAFEEFGAAQADLTPEEIAQNNFGLPIWRQCMLDLGWEVGELVPDERGALGPGGALTPPEGTDPLDLDDVNTCRQESEAYTEANYVAEEG